MTLEQVAEAEYQRCHRAHLLRQQHAIIGAEGQELLSHLADALYEQLELLPIIRAIVLHQLSWSVAEANTALRRLGVEVDALG